MGLFFFNATRPWKGLILKPNLVKFYVIEYPSFKNDPEGGDFVILHRLFDYETSQRDAEKFCAELKATGAAVNIRVRSIDTNLFL